MKLFAWLSNKSSWIVICLTILGALLYFFNLNWGAPYYFHPDERNVASAVSQLHFPDQLNPHFFAYGSLPIYVVFFTALIFNVLSDFSLLTSHLPASPAGWSLPNVSFDQAILIGRIYSALFATMIIPFLFLIAKKVTGRKSAGIVAAALATTSVGLLQFAHFGTFELWLTFFSLLLFWVCIQLIQKKKILFVFFLGLVFGILFAIKISSLALLPISLLALAIAYRPFSLRRKSNEADKFQSRTTKLKKFFFFFISILIFSTIAAFIYIVTNPFVFLDTESFLSSIRYESSVGFNTLPVFYTQGFYETVPVLYQFLNIYPFLLNPLLTFLLIPSFLYFLWQTWRTKNSKLFILAIFFLILFLSQAVLFIKWTRYMVPTLPFVYLIIAFALTDVIANKAKKSLLVTCIIIISSIFSLSYFITAFIQPDTRIAALDYAKDRIPENTPILSETYDIGITAFNSTLSDIMIFNTYDLDADSPDYNEDTWETALEDAEYIILPSQRVLQTRIQNPKRFPVGNKVYAALLDGSGGFEKIYETPCDIFCQITYLGDPVFRFEQTANVFDRPTVYIFQKAK